MESAATVVVTKKEALSVLGVRASSLDRLEKLARLRVVPRRIGYSGQELRRLLWALKRAIARHEGEA